MLFLTKVVGLHWKVKKKSNKKNAKIIWGAIEVTSLSNDACLYITDSLSNRKPNSYISCLDDYVYLYETLHLQMIGHFLKVTETGPSLKQILLQYNKLPMWDPYFIIYYVMKCRKTLFKYNACISQP